MIKFIDKEFIIPEWVKKIDVESDDFTGALLSITLYPRVNNYKIVIGENIIKTDGYKKSD